MRREAPGLRREKPPDFVVFAWLNNDPLLSGAGL